MREGLIRKVRFEQRFAGGERVGLVDVWGGACLAKGAASAKALGQGELVCCRSSEEAIVAGAEGKGRDVKEEVREMGAGGGRFCCHFSHGKDLAFILIARC